MSVEEITQQVMENLKESIYEEAKKIIPELLKSIVPSIVALTKDYILNELRNTDGNVQSYIRECITPPDVEVRNFKREHTTDFDNRLNTRENEYYKYARCENLLDLYAEGMQEEPIYIPKKFRNDKMHVMSPPELSVVEKLERNRLKAECEILTIRKQEFMERVTKVDTEVYDFINQSNISAKANEDLINKWQFIINEDKTKIDLKWKKKIESIKIAYKKDKDFLKNHRETRISANKNTDSTFGNENENENSTEEVDNSNEKNESANHTTIPTTREDRSKNENSQVSPQRHKYFLRS
jgi:hypothetical protein